MLNVDSLVRSEGTRCEDHQAPSESLIYRCLFVAIAMRCFLGSGIAVMRQLPIAKDPAHCGLVGLGATECSTVFETVSRLWSSNKHLDNKADEEVARALTH